MKKISTKTPAPVPIPARINSLHKSLFLGALAVAPIVLSAAPSSAITLSTTITGFNDAFAPVVWNTSTSGTATAIFNGDDDSATTLTLTKSAGNAGESQAVFLFDQSLVDDLRPAGAGDFIGYSYKYTWSWSFTTSGTTPATNGSWDFNAINFNDTTVALDKLNTSAPLSSVVYNFSSATIPNTFGVELKRLGSNAGGTGTAVISNFEFVAIYDIPGPLPIVGAGAAFAWSRRLRRRLNTANTFV